MEWARIWANRLLGHTKTWAEVPDKRKVEVKAELQARLADGRITQAEYDEVGVE